MQVLRNFHTHKPPVPTFEERYDRWGYQNADGSWPIGPQFADVQPFREGVAWVRPVGIETWGLIAEDGRLLRTIRLPAGPGDIGKAYAAAISPDAALIAAGGWTRGVAGDESVYLFERASGRLLRRVGGLADVVNHLAFSPDGTRLAAVLGGKGGVRLIDPAIGRVVALGA